MFELARYEGRHRIRGALALTVGLSALVALYVAMFPSVSSSVDLDEYMRAFPPALREAFGIATLSTIEGFLAAELYAFGWVLLLGLYFAYAAAGLVADDVERGRMDLLLSLPVTRSRLVTEKFLSLLVPMAVLNVAVPVVVYVATALIDDPIAVADLLAVHALSVPYLLATASVGLLASVAFDRVSIAQRAALAALFGLFLVNSVASGTDYAWLGALAPMRYYDPTAVLVEGTYDLGGAALLLVAALVLVGASELWFARRDIN
ncbi:ABC transporter permease subunit (plasmid) [Halorarum halophilum]|uniref:ABC transporter permease subunit n=1 Tax=Halorarum halophilum TaxID=2743090 RepID=A0A7D5GZM9_9EURY|nr:ABC transporter permease subunit [Halobaculum halophilum]QLG29689.1 ABC transporter permease subunit [Halobaculum halophilum]